MGKFIDRSGQRFGRLTVVARCEDGPASNGRRVKWVCECDCGGRKTVTGHALASGETRSCGCMRIETIGTKRRTHGMTKTPTHNSWRAAKERCHNPNHEKFSAYGGAGIEMCERWRFSFENFLADMGERPEGTTIDRLDQCKGYEPGNCQWASPDEQSTNRGNTQLYRWRGGWMTRKEISRAEAIPYTSLGKALRKTNTIQAAVAHVRSRLGRSGSQNLNPDT